MGGGGVNASNVQRIVEEGGLGAVHLSGSAPVCAYGEGAGCCHLAAPALPMELLRYRRTDDGVLECFLSVLGR